LRRRRHGRPVRSAAKSGTRDRSRLDRRRRAIAARAENGVATRPLHAASEGLARGNSTPQLSLPRESKRPTASFPIGRASSWTNSAELFAWLKHTKSRNSSENFNQG